MNGSIVIFGNNYLEFMLRMNKTYVNHEGRYIKLQFRGAKFFGPREIKDDMVRYYDKDYMAIAPFSQVQCNSREKPADLTQSKVQLPTVLSSANDDSGSWIVNQSLGKYCAFTYNSYCFIGNISDHSGDFRYNNVVKSFFDHCKLGPNCFVDEMGTTFFVLKDSTNWWKNSGKVVPSFVDEKFEAGKSYGWKWGVID
ncbi:hypothetical protein NE237_012166 [Protea cynaroides]|uniref:Uncharacterized protein n=1 Tax=Protea cynaroides TaxID=273540 RepID=A0A9Q0JYZ3_9MAGN|nr:hypothetical protein NE237_012166 [Protea cynaroides]